MRFSVQRNDKCLEIQNLLCNFAAEYYLNLKTTIMEPFGIFGVFFGLVSIVLGLVWFICCVILFFKVWGMCNDVRQILQILAQRRNEG